MLRFVAQGREGMVLGLGLSEGNLARLANDEPIAFNLDEFGLAPRVFILAIPGSAVVGEGRAALAEADAHVMELSLETLDDLRTKGALMVELPEAPAGLTHAMLAHADTELDILAAFREAGLVLAETEVRGLGQYFEDLERRGPVSPSDKNNENNGQDEESKRSENRQDRRPWWARLSAKPGFWLALVVVFAALVAGITEGVDALRGPSRRLSSALELSPTPQPTSEVERRRLVDALHPRVLGAIPGPRPCPHAVWLPAPFGEDPVLYRSTRDGADVRSSEALALVLERRFDRGLLDLAPVAQGELADVAGLRHSVRVPPHRDHWRGVTTHATLVLESLEDAHILGSVGDERVTEQALLGGSRVTTTQDIALIPGRARARLVVWSYAHADFVCASETVEVETPPVQFIAYEGEDRASIEADRQLLKTRAELLIAAAHAAHAQLRAVE